MAKKLGLMGYWAVIIAAVVVVIANVVVSVLPKSSELSYDMTKSLKENNYAKMSKAATGAGGIVFLGDSITEMCDIENYYSVTGKKLFNRGIIGDYTARMLARIEDNVSIIKPETVVLLVGVNDLGRGKSVEETALGVEGIIHKLKDESRKSIGNNLGGDMAKSEVKIILRAVYPVNAEVTSFAKKMVGRRTNEDIDKLNARLCEIAGQKGCIWVDYTDNIKDENGKLKSDFTHDGLHVNSQVYKISAERILPYL